MLIIIIFDTFFTEYSSIYAHVISNYFLSSTAYKQSRIEKKTQKEAKAKAKKSADSSNVADTSADIADVSITSNKSVDEEESEEGKASPEKEPPAPESEEVMEES